MNDMRHAARLIRQRQDGTWILDTSRNLPRDDWPGDVALSGVDGFGSGIVGLLPSVWASSSQDPSSPAAYTAYGIVPGPVHPSDVALAAVTSAADTAFSEVPSGIPGRLAAYWYALWLQTAPFAGMGPPDGSTPPGYVAPPLSAGDPLEGSAVSAMEGRLASIGAHVLAMAGSASWTRTADATWHVDSTSSYTYDESTRTGTTASRVDAALDGVVYGGDFSTGTWMHVLPSSWPGPVPSRVVCVMSARLSWASVANGVADLDVVRSFADGSESRTALVPALRSFSAPADVYRRFVLDASALSGTVRRNPSDGGIEVFVDPSAVLSGAPLSGTMWDTDAVFSVSSDAPWTGTRTSTPSTVSGDDVYAVPGTYSAHFELTVDVSAGVCVAFAGEGGS